MDSFFTKKELSQLRDKKIVIIGGCGFIGGHLCQFLHSINIKSVVCIDNSGKKHRIAQLLNKPRFDYFEYSIFDNKDEISQIFENESPNIIIYLASSSKNNKFTEDYSNLLTEFRKFINVVELANLYQIPLYYALSRNILGFSLESPSPIKLDNNFINNKKEINLLGLFEKMCYEFANNQHPNLSKALIISDIYGPMDKSIISKNIQKYMTNEPIKNYKNYIWDLCHIEDCVIMILKTILHSSLHSNNCEFISTGSIISSDDLNTIICGFCEAEKGKKLNEIEIKKNEEEIKINLLNYTQPNLKINQLDVVDFLPIQSGLQDLIKFYHTLLLYKDSHKT